MCGTSDETPASRLLCEPPDMSSTLTIRCLLCERVGGLCPYKKSQRSYVREQSEKTVKAITVRCINSIVNRPFKYHTIRGGRYITASVIQRNLNPKFEHQFAQD